MSEKYVGTRIKAARERKGWSQVALGKAIQVRGAAVTQWEKGHTQPTRANILRVAEALEVPAEWLLSGLGVSPFVGSTLPFVAGADPDPAARTAAAVEYIAEQIFHIRQALEVIAAAKSPK